MCIARKILELLTVATLSVLVLSGCSFGQRHSLQANDHHHRAHGSQGVVGDVRRNWVLSEKASLMVLRPESTLLTDAQAFDLQKHMQVALNRYFSRVSIQHPGESLYGRDYDYSVQVEVLHQKERTSSVSEWLQIGEKPPIGRDSVMIKVSLFESRQAKPIDVSWYGVSSFPLRLKKGTVHDLLSETMGRYARGLSAVGVM